MSEIKPLAFSERTTATMALVSALLTPMLAKLVMVKFSPNFGLNSD